MTEAGAVDPLRAEVEAAMRRFVVDVVTLPCHVARSVGGRVARPFVLARSLASLTASGLLGRAGLIRDAAPRRRSPRPTTTPRWVDPVADVDVVPEPTAAEPDGSGPTASELPIDEYESLAASQVVDRLERLDAGELRRIEAFETAHRGRRTVLGKIEQLLATPGR